MDEIGQGQKVNFYPRSPRGERRPNSRLSLPSNLFLSTLPARGATRVPVPAAPGRTISIHAPREGSDLVDIPAIVAKDISIHAPREGSDAPRRSACIRRRGFLSTLPARGATSYEPNTEAWEA